MGGECRAAGPVRLASELRDQLVAQLVEAFLQRIGRESRRRDDETADAQVLETLHLVGGRQAPGRDLDLRGITPDAIAFGLQLGEALVELVGARREEAVSEPGRAASGGLRMSADDDRNASGEGR